MKIDWERRELCPDGACVGVIGPDGLCKVCGRVAPNLDNDRLRGLADDESGTDDDETDDEDDDALDAAEDAAANSEASDAEWDRRELCSNGACVGVIDETGVCSVCGSPRA